MFLYKYTGSLSALTNGPITSFSSPAGEPVNSDSWESQQCGGCFLRRGGGLNGVRQADVAARMLGRFIFIQFRGFLLALSQVGVGRNGYPGGRRVTRFPFFNPPQNEERESHKQEMSFHTVFTSTIPRPIRAARTLCQRAPFFGNREKLGQCRAADRHSCTLRVSKD